MFNHLSTILNFVEIIATAKCERVWYDKKKTWNKDIIQIRVRNEPHKTIMRCE